MVRSIVCFALLTSSLSCATASPAAGPAPAASAPAPEPIAAPLQVVGIGGCPTLSDCLALVAQVVGRDDPNALLPPGSGPAAGQAPASVVLVSDGQELHQVVAFGIGEDLAQWRAHNVTFEPEGDDVFRDREHGRWYMARGGTMWAGPERAAVAAARDRPLALPSAPPQTIAWGTIDVRAVPAARLGQLLSRTSDALARSVADTERVDVRVHKAANTRLGVTYEQFAAPRSAFAGRLAVQQACASTLIGLMDGTSAAQIHVCTNDWRTDRDDAEAELAAAVDQVRTLQAGDDSLSVEGRGVVDSAVRFLTAIAAARAFEVVMLLEEPHGQPIVTLALRGLPATVWEDLSTAAVPLSESGEIEALPLIRAEPSRRGPSVFSIDTTGRVAGMIDGSSSVVWTAQGDVLLVLFGATAGLHDRAKKRVRRAVAGKPTTVSTQSQGAVDVPQLMRALSGPWPMLKVLSYTVPADIGKLGFTVRAEGLRRILEFDFDLRLVATGRALLALGK